MSRSIPKKRGNVKPAKGAKPARYTRKVDSLGRRYTIDKTTGTRVSNELWERERAKLRKAREKQSAPKPKASKQDRIFQLAVEARQRALENRAERSVSIPRNIFDVWDIPNEQWKLEHPESIPRNTLAGQDWQPEEWVDEDEELLFSHEKDEREAELRFRAAKAIRDRELLEAAEEFIPTSHIKGFSESILERAKRYPRVKRALTLATSYAAVERDEVTLGESTVGRPPTKDEHIRSRFLFAIENDEDIESVVGDLADLFEEEVHDIYEIYFSPEVA